MSSSTEPLELVIARSPVRRLSDGYGVFRCDDVRRPQEHVVVARAEGETTVVTRRPEPQWSQTVSAEMGFTLIALDVGAPFAAPGFLAAACGTVAAMGINVLIHSTFSRDYLLIRTADADRALAALAARGFPL
jgi:hypothetical protein